MAATTSTRLAEEVSTISMYVPKQLFFTKGVGTHREKLTSFELALRDASIAYYNLVRVSSIFPPNCEEVSVEEGLKQLSPGQIVHCVMSESATAEPNRLIAASVGVAIPRDRNTFGYLSEHHAYGQTAKVAADYAEDLAAEMLATVLGVEFNPDSSWDEKREIWKIADVIYRTKEVTASAIGHKDGLWTTVVASAILLP
jgi:arginine decarboxylase